MIPTVIGVYGTVTEGLVQRLEDFEIRGPSKQQLYYDLPKYRDEPRKLEKTYHSLKSREKTSANAGVQSTSLSRLTTV